MPSTPRAQTGRDAERLARERLEEFGFEVSKRPGDRSTAFLVRLPGTEPCVTVRVRSRGSPGDGTFRWFQLRTDADRERAKAAGLPESDAWRLSVKEYDFFLLVALHHQECWVFPQGRLADLCESRRPKDAGRPDNVRGEQVELNLDVEHNGLLLATSYASYREAFVLIEDELRTRVAGSERK